VVYLFWSHFTSWTDLHADLGFRDRLCRLEEEFPGANILCFKQMGSVPQVTLVLYRYLTVCAVTFIKQPTWLKQSYRMFPNFNFVLIFTYSKNSPALSSHFCASLRRLPDTGLTDCILRPNKCSSVSLAAALFHPLFKIVIQKIVPIFSSN